VDEMTAHIEAFTRTLPSSELLAQFARHHVPAAEVRSPREAVRDPRVLARSETVPLEHPQYGRVADVVGTGIPIRFSEAPAVPVRAAPGVGEDNGLVYGDWLGYGADGVEQLRAAGII
jgi:crotonobetainyl-CoA:carnitine CoA-transferase CaiB-like acyl-CoA transferase